MTRIVLLSLLIILFMETMLGFSLSLAPGLSVKNAFLYLLLMALAIRAAMAGEQSFSGLRRVHTYFVLLLIWATVSWAFTPGLNPWGLDYDMVGNFITLKGQLIDHYLFFLAFLYGVRSRDDALWITSALMLFVAMSNVVTLIDVFNMPNLGVIHERADGRVSGPLGESNQYATFLVLFLPGIVAATYRARGWRRWVWGAGMLASVAVLLLTTSRGALAGLLLGLVGTGWYLRRYLPKGQALKKVAVIFALAGVVTAVIGTQYSDLLFDRFVAKASLQDMQQVSSGRTENWTTALTAQAEHPTAYIWGMGWSTYKEMFAGRASHNSYLSFFFELGVIGLLLFVGLIAAFFKTARRAIAQAPPEARIELMVFVVGFMALLGAVFFVNLYRPWLFVWAYVGLMMRVAVGLMETAAEPEPSRPPPRVLQLGHRQGGSPA